MKNFSFIVPLKINFSTFKIKLINFFSFSQKLKSNIKRETDNYLYEKM